MKLLNYHYLKAELFSLGKINIKNFNKYKYNSSPIIWNNLFLNRYPFSTATQGILKILQIYGVNDVNQKFETIFKITNENQLSEGDIFQITGVKQVVMTNNPFNKKENIILRSNKDKRYLPSIRIDDLFNVTKNTIASYNLKTFENIKKTNSGAVVSTVDKDGNKFLIIY